MVRFFLVSFVLFALTDSLCNFDRVWKGFTSSARKDGAIFYHWVRSDSEYTDYPFARFNKRMEILRYTDLEYRECFSPFPTDAGQPLTPAQIRHNEYEASWTKEQTDHLFDLCRRFELRWPVIADRFEGVPPRTVEELKLRYFTVVSAVVAHRRNRAKAEGMNPDILLGAFRDYENFQYNIEHETRRRKALDGAFRRSNEDLAEERKLLRDLAMVEAQIRRAEIRLIRNASNTNFTRILASEWMEKHRNQLPPLPDYLEESIDEDEEVVNSDAENNTDEQATKNDGSGNEPFLMNRAGFDLESESAKRKSVSTPYLLSPEELDPDSDVEGAQVGKSDMTVSTGFSKLVSSDSNLSPSSSMISVPVADLGTDTKNQKIVEANVLVVRNLALKANPIISTPGLSMDDLNTDDSASDSTTDPDPKKSLDTQRTQNTNAPPSRANLSQSGNARKPGQFGYVATPTQQVPTSTADNPFLGVSLRSQQFAAGIDGAAPKSRTALKANSLIQELNSSLVPFVYFENKTEAAVDNDDTGSDDDTFGELKPLMEKTHLASVASPLYVTPPASLASINRDRVGQRFSETLFPMQNATPSIMTGKVLSQFTLLRREVFTLLSLAKLVDLQEKLVYKLEKCRKNAAGIAQCIPANTPTVHEGNVLDSSAPYEVPTPVPPNTTFSKSACELSDNVSNILNQIREQVRQEGSDKLPAKGTSPTTTAAPGSTVLSYSITGRTTSTQLGTGATPNTLDSAASSPPAVSITIPASSPTTPFAKAPLVTIHHDSLFSASNLQVEVSAKVAPLSTPDLLTKNALSEPSILELPPHIAESLQSFSARHSVPLDLGSTKNIESLKSAVNFPQQFSTNKWDDVSGSMNKATENAASNATESLSNEVQDPSLSLIHPLHSISTMQAQQYLLARTADATQKHTPKPMMQLPKIQINNAQFNRHLPGALQNANFANQLYPGLASQMSSIAQGSNYFQNSQYFLQMSQQGAQGLNVAGSPTDSFGAKGASAFPQGTPVSSAAASPLPNASPTSLQSFLPYFQNVSLSSQQQHAVNPMNSRDSSTSVDSDVAMATHSAQNSTLSSYNTSYASASLSAGSLSGRSTKSTSAHTTHSPFAHSSARSTVAPVAHTLRQGGTPVAGTGSNGATPTGVNVGALSFQNALNSINAGVNNMHSNTVPQFSNNMMYNNSLIQTIRQQLFNTGASSLASNLPGSTPQTPNSAALPRSRAGSTAPNVAMSGVNTPGFSSALNMGHPAQRDARDSTFSATLQSIVNANNPSLSTAASSLSTATPHAVAPGSINQATHSLYPSASRSGYSVDLPNINVVHRSLAASTSSGSTGSAHGTMQNPTPSPSPSPTPSPTPTPTLNLTNLSSALAQLGNSQLLSRQGGASGGMNPLASTGNLQNFSMFNLPQNIILSILNAISPQNTVNTSQLAALQSSLVSSQFQNANMSAHATTPSAHSAFAANQSGSRATPNPGTPSTIGASVGAAGSSSHMSVNLNPHTVNWHGSPTGQMSPAQNLTSTVHGGADLAASAGKKRNVRDGAADLGEKMPRS